MSMFHVSLPGCTLPYQILDSKAGFFKVPEYDVLVTNPPYSGEHVVTWMWLPWVVIGCYKG